MDCVFLGGDGRPEISPPRSFLKVGAYDWSCSFISVCRVVTASADVCIHGGTLSVGPKVHSPSVLVRQRICRKRRSKKLLFLSLCVYNS